LITDEEDNYEARYSKQQYTTGQNYEIFQHDRKTDGQGAGGILTNLIFVLSVPPTTVLCGHMNKILVPTRLCGIYKMSGKALQQTLKSPAAEARR
jgi:hypothetical protein